MLFKSAICEAPVPPNTCYIKKQLFFSLSFSFLFFSDDWLLWCIMQRSTPAFVLRSHYQDS